ncbi:MAG: hypothetical protein K0R59_3590 [Sphingobacterium sp.]|jgi:hypothetical protein|uniref:hypothetical protein n=1 Tax=unclassified Sphingobacterium TaxID=2609468 RepID=UPI0009846B0D|nr:hypothetical protein [Sphingobacterium sp. CZ-UAM]MDF2518294.1 hypothetical protein [Sphingobacterium sp.]OOG16230.1 hypothetical protein BWD42_21040 [Sphingobacterium sp. CZ-UAM]
MKKAIYLFVLSIFLFLGCKKSDDKTDPELAGPQVEIKGVSGWGDVVNIIIDKNKTEIRYPKSIVPEAPKDKVYKTSDVTFEQLSNYIDAYKLMDAKIEECARCVDGTDYVITLKYKGRENTITIAAHRTDGKYADLLKLIGTLY